MFTDHRADGQSLVDQVRQESFALADALRAQHPAAWNALRNRTTALLQTIDQLSHDYLLTLAASEQAMAALQERTSKEVLEAEAHLDVLRAQEAALVWLRIRQERRVAGLHRDLSLWQDAAR